MSPAVGSALPDFPDSMLLHSSASEPRNAEVLVSRSLSDYRPISFPNLSTRRHPVHAPNISHIHLDKSFNELQKLADTAGADSIQIIAYAAALKCLSLYTGERDILLGEASPGLTNSAVCPLRLQLTTDITWREALQALNQQLNGLAQWTTTLSNASTPSPTPFLAVFVREDTTHLANHGLDLLHNLGTAVALQLTCQSGILSLSTLCNSSVMSSSVALTFTQQVASLMDVIVQDPDARVSLPLTEHHISKTLLSIYEPEDVREDKNEIVTETLRCQALQRPDATAIEWYETMDPIGTPTRMSYRELDERSNQVARLLVRRGLRLEDKVALCGPRDLDFHVAFMAILKAGGCYVPIDPDLPNERKTFIIKDSNARLVIAAPDQAQLFGDLSLVLSEPDARRLLSTLDSSALVTPTLDSLAYLLYTSGTSGAPKGCLVTHRGLSAATGTLCASYKTTVDAESDKQLGTASIAFDVHLGEMLGAWKYGMRICTGPRSELLANLADVIQTIRITHVAMVPSLMEAVILPIKHKLPLKFIASGGEKLSDAVLDWWASNPDIQLTNFYGPSETTIGVSAHTMRLSDVKSNIGKTVSACASYVVDENLNPVLRGTPGELVVEGNLVGRGYNGRPDLTAKAFAEWPRRGCWSYRTGDLVRMMPDSSMEIVGRVDSQIKLRGVRIEAEGISNTLRLAWTAAPIEVSTVLTRHPDIGAEQLVSFASTGGEVSVKTRTTVLPTIDRSASALALLLTLEGASTRELASYMRPSHIIPLSHLPLTNNGKVDNKTLTTLFQSTSLRELANLKESEVESGPETRRASIAMELAVSEIVSLHTKIPRSILGPNSNLFECGLDSLKLIVVVADLRKMSDNPISVRDIMTCPTISAVASVLEGLADSKPKCSAAVLDMDWYSKTHRRDVEQIFDPLDIEYILPSYPVQQGVLYKSLEEHSATYVQHVILRLGGSISIPRLRQAWQDAMKHHVILRTAFVFGKELLQVVLRHDRCMLPWSEHETNVDDFSSWFSTHEAHGVARDISEDTKTALFRLRLYALPNTHMLCLSMHHAIYDGFALPLLLKSIDKLYNGDIPSPDTSFVPILQHIHSFDDAEARIFWQNQFVEFDFARHPPRPPSGRNAKIVKHNFRSSLSTLEAAAAANKVTLQAFILSAFGIMAQQEIYHSSDIVIGVVRAGRSLPVEGAASAVCPLVTVLPSRLSLEHSSTAALVQTVQKNVSSNLGFEHVPLGKVQGWVNMGKSMFELVFSYAVNQSDLAQSALWELEENAPPQPDFLLAVEVVADLNDSVSVGAVFAEEDFSVEVIEDLLRRLETNTNTMASDIPISGGSLAPLQYEQRSDRPPEDSPSRSIDANREHQLCGLVASFLEIDAQTIAPAQSLIALGLDSLKAVRLSRLLRDHNISTSAAEVMNNPTIQGLAQAPTLTGMDSKLEQAASNLLATRQRTLKLHLPLEPLKLDPEDECQVYPATGLQSGMLAQTVSSNGGLYVHAFPLKLGAEVEMSRFQRSWRTTVQNVEILRTTFHFVEALGQWAQVVHSKAHFDWTEEHLAGERLIKKEVSAWISSLVLGNEYGFTLPPIRFKIFYQNDNALPTLVLAMHHAIYDGDSLAKLLDLVRQAYHGADAVPTVPFKQILGPVLYQEEHGIPFWVRRLEGVKPLSFPRCGDPTSDGSWQVRRDLVVSVLSLERACRRHEVTMQSIGQAAWARVLAEVFQTEDVVFGQVVSGRSLKDSEDTVGPVLNTIVCYAKISPSTTNKALIRETHKANVDAIPWQHVPLRSIQRALGVSNIFDSLFLFQKDARTRVDSLWDFDEAFADTTGQSQYAVNIEFQQGELGMHVSATCRMDVMAQRAFNELVDRFEFMLRELAEHPLATISNGPPTQPDLRANTVPQPLPTPPPEAYPEADQKDATTGHSLQSILRDVVSAATRVPADYIKSSSSLASLGIDSISAIHVAAKCRRAGLKAAAADIIKSRTFGDLLHAVEIKQKAESSALTPSTSARSAAPMPTPPRSSSDILDSLQFIENVAPVSPGMEWLIGAWQRSQGSRFQHAFTFKGSSQLDVQRLHRAWNSLVRTHPILRSTFVASSATKSDRVEMVTFSDFESNWTERVIRNHVRDIDGISELLLEWVSDPPSTRSPPIRAGIVYGFSETYLVVHLHHFQYDGWSLQLLVKDLCALYEGGQVLASNDYSPFLDLYRSEGSLVEQEKYWGDALGTSPPSLFPQLNPTSKVDHRTNHIQIDAIPGARNLLHQARSANLSLQSVFLTAWSLVQASYTSRKEVTFGLWSAGRGGDTEDIQRLAMPSMNVLPFRVKLADGMPPLELALTVQDELRKRTPVVEQTRLVDIDKWVQGTGKPLNNVFVNILGLPGMHVENEKEAVPDLLEPVRIPYKVPPPRTACPDPGLARRLAVTELIQDDVLVEIGFDLANDTIFFALESDAKFLDAAQAAKVAGEWVSEVKGILGLSSPPAEESKPLAFFRRFLALFGSPRVLEEPK